MERIRQAVILAGGLGTRLLPFTYDDPKPMYPISGKPYLEYLIEQIKSFGITDILLLLGYKAGRITEYFGDGSRFGVKIRYSVSDVEHETQRRLYLARKLINDDFLLMYCDNYCPLDFAEMCGSFYNTGALIQVTAYDNTDKYTKSNLLVGERGEVVIYDKSRRASNLNGVDIGYALVKRCVLDIIDGENVNFEKNIYNRLVSEKKLYCHMTGHRYYSIGSFERIELTREFFSNRKTVFLDRDGTLNVRPPSACYVTKDSEFIWIDGAREAVKLLNDGGYRVFIATNQPGIARGMVTERDLNEIHVKMMAELAEIGARIDKIYVCTHGWNDGCGCRKPKPGLLWQAQREFNFNMRNAVFFGDDTRDMEAATSAGCAGVMVSDDYALYDAVSDFMKG